MGIDLSKSRQVIFFILCLSIFSFLLVKIENYLLQPFINTSYYIYLDTFGFVGFYILLFSWFNSLLWKNHIFKWFGLVGFPVLDGRWKGTIISSYKGETTIPAYLEIKQNFLGISIYLYAEKSSSSSIIANIIKKKDGQFELHYEYDNDPNENATKTMHTHIGIVRLRYLPDRHKLIGYYFNENRHERGYSGKINFQFESETRLNRF